MEPNEAQKKMERLENLSNADLIERAWQELSALCDSFKKWLMSIPVDADRDSDVLFGEVLKRFAQLEAENKLKQAEIEGLGSILLDVQQEYVSLWKELQQLRIEGAGADDC